LRRKTDIKRVLALAGISRSRYVVTATKPRSAPFANPRNSAQLGATFYRSPKLHPGACSSVGMRRGTDRHTVTDRHVE